MLLNVVEIEKYYGTRNNLKKALDRVSFSVNSGDFVSIMGASGSGKTTLLNCISTIDSVRRIAQPIKFNIPNQIICAGMATNVIIEISSPKRLNMIPRRKFFSFPHTHTKPEIKMNVQHIACCQIWIAGRLYHVGDFSYTIYTSYKK